MDINVNQKNLIRKEMLAQRKNLSEQAFAQATQAFFEKITALPEYQSADTILSYASYRHEADTWQIIEQALKDGKKVALPKVEGKLMMKFYEIASLDDLTQGCMGILEPDTEHKNLKEATEGFMVMPGVAFDKDGHRMGYGGGYYDHWLSQYKANVFSCAVAYDFQVLDAIPYDDYDQSPDMILTPTTIYRKQ